MSETPFQRQYRKTVKNMTVAKKLAEQCPGCKGRGWVFLDMMGNDGQFKCTTCNGTGKRK